ncbi:MAG: P-loop NTPase fold protein [Phycisphaerales bacterium]
MADNKLQHGKAQLLSKSKLKPLRLLEDEPVPHHDRDELQLLPFANIVAGAAVGTDGPFTIGVFADWGQGKTSVLRQARSLIEHSPEHSDIVTVWFNAWQFEREEHPIVPLLASIVAAVDAARAHAERDASLAKKIGQRGKEGWAKLSRALRAMAYGFSAKTTVKVPGFADVEAEFVAKEMIERFEKLSAGDGAKGSDPLLMRSLYFDAFELLQNVVQPAESEGEESPWRPRIVVFVDDLDRCMPDKALALLEGVKLALAQRGFIFVLAVAKRVLESYLKKRYRDDYGMESYADGASYLDKMVQLPLPIPPHKERFADYVTKLITAQLGRLDQEAAVMMQPIAPLLAIGSDDTPRSLVRLVNNLLVDVRLRSLTAPANDPLKQADFVGLCAVARSLQLHLSTDAYATLVDDQDLCTLLAEEGLSGLDEWSNTGGTWLPQPRTKDQPRVTTAVASPSASGAHASRSPALGGPPGSGGNPPSPTGERLSVLRKDRWRLTISELQRHDFLGELFEHAFAKRWLKNKQERAVVDRFLAAQRQEPDVKPETQADIDQLAVVERAIRQSLKLAAVDLIDDKAKSLVKTLNLAGSGLTDAGALHLKDATSLQKLMLNGTAITDKGLETIKRLTSLTTLVLDETAVTDNGVEQLKGLASLQELSLEDTAVTDKSLGHVKVLPSLQTLYLDGTAVTDKGLEHIRRLLSLTNLSFKRTAVTDNGLEHLKGLASLLELSLSYTSVTDKGLEHLIGLLSLEYLTLNGTAVTDRGLGHLKQLPSIHYLNLDDTAVTDKGLEHLKDRRRLLTLSLERTKVTDKGLEHIKGLTSLRTLYLNDTAVSENGVRMLQTFLPDISIRR